MQVSHQDVAMPGADSGIVVTEVLLVDEDTRQLEQLAAMLQQEGLAVVTSASYDEGADLVGYGSFDLAVVTQGGPRFEGKCVLERARLAVPRTPVLVVARCAEVAAYLRAMELGAADYIERPIDLDVLIGLIRSLPGEPDIRPVLSGPRVEHLAQLKHRNRFARSAISRAAG